MFRFFSFFVINCKLFFHNKFASCTDGLVFFSSQGKPSRNLFGCRRCEVFNEAVTLCNPLWNINKVPKK